MKSVRFELSLICAGCLLLPPNNKKSWFWKFEYIKPTKHELVDRSNNSDQKWHLKAPRWSWEEGKKSFWQTTSAVSFQWQRRVFVLLICKSDYRIERKRQKERRDGRSLNEFALKTNRETGLLSYWPSNRGGVTPRPFALMPRSSCII